MSTRHKYKIGVLGLGMGKNWAESVTKNKDAGLTLVFDPEMEKSRTLARQFNSRSANSENDFFKTPLDVVIVATPDHLHTGQSVRALSLGSHVICEKPMAPTISDCRKIIAAVRKYKRYFMVGQVCRFAPAFCRAKELVASREIGEIAFIESEYYHDYTHTVGVKNWRKDPKIRREGFIGGGCHAMDLIRWIAGDPREIFCYMNHKFLPDWSTNDTGVAIFKFPNNVIGKVFVSIGVKAGYSMRTVIHGTKGSIFCDNTSDNLKLYTKRFKPSAGYLSIPVLVNNHNTDAEVDEFVRCLNNNKRPPTDEIEGTKTVAFGEAALKSAQTGKPVKFVY